MAKSKTYEMLLKIAGKTDSSLNKACSEAEKNLAAIGNAAKAAAKTAAMVGTAVAAAAVAAGKALYDLGSEFDGAYDAIRIGTGATGEALEGLKDSMKAVYGSVPAEMSDAAQAIADYNTRLGVTGETLETLSKQAIQVGDMLGEGLTTVIETSSKAFQQWDVAEENMADNMDYVFKVSQSTGVGFSNLMGNMQSYGAQLQEMGYSFGESATLLGQLEKAGVNASEVMSAMKKSVTTMAKEGLSASDGMQQYYDAIKSAETATEAISIASEVFGSKAGSTMALAIRDGTLAVGNLTDELLKSTETISGAASDTYSFSEKWQMFTNRMKVALEPMAMSLFDSLSDAMDTLMPVTEAVLPVITSAVNSILPTVSEKLGEIIPQVVEVAKWAREHKDVILAIAAGIATAIGAYKAYNLAITAYNAAMGIYKIVTAASATGTFTLAGAMTALNIPVLAAVAGIGLLVAGGILLYKNWDTVKAKAAELGQKIGEIWSNISGSVQAAIDAIGGRFPLLGAYLQGWWNSIQAAWTNVQAIFSNIIDFIDNVFAGNWTSAWQNIVNIFANLFGMIVNLAKAPINGVISAINFVLEKINGISVTIPDWVPGVGGTTLGFSIPTIPQLATGGIVTAPTILEAGEGGEPEAVMPLSKLSAMLQDGPEEAPLAQLAKMLDDWTKNPKPGQQGPDIGGNDSPPPAGDQNPQDNGGDNLTFVFHYHGTASPEQAKEAGRIGFTEFKRLYQQMKAEERRKNLRTSTH